MYVLCQKVRNKVYALAGTTDASCLARASDRFIECGLPNEWRVPGVSVRYEEQVQAQKNYAGRVDGFKIV